VAVGEIALARTDSIITEENVSATADTDLLKRWKRGDLSGFDALMSRYERPLYCLIRRIVRNEQDSQDILQETLVRLYRSMDRLREGVSLQPWLYRTASNLAIDHLRKMKPGRTVSLEEKQESEGKEPERIDEQSPEDPRKRTIRKQLEQRLIEAMNRLPKRQQAAMTLRCLQDLSMHEIAEILQCKERTVGTTLFAARKKLMEELEPLLADLLSMS